MSRKSRRNAQSQHSNEAAAVSAETLEGRQLLTTVFGTPQVVDAIHSPARQVAIGDVDNDGRNDIATSGLQYTSVFRSNGDSSFTRLATVSNNRDFISGRYLYAQPKVSIADADGDGRAELVQVYDQGDNNDPELQSRQLNSGNWNSEAGVHRSPWGGGASLVQDIDGDGKADLASIETNGNNGIDTLYAALKLRTGSDFNVVFTASMGSNNGDYVTNSELTAADIDGDGDTDLAFVSNRNRLTIFRQTSGGQFSIHRDVALLQDREGVGFADIDGDGDEDLYYAMRLHDRVGIHLNDGSGQFGSLISFSVNADAPIDVVARDLNGDGRKDLVTANQDNTISVLTGNASGTVSFLATYPAAPSGYRPSDIELGDVTGDGVVDAVIAHNSSKLTVLPGIGQASGKPDLLVSSMSVSGSTIDLQNSDRSVSFSYRLLNEGTAAAPGNYEYAVGTYLSRDTVYDQSDRRLKYVFTDDPIAVGGHQDLQLTAILPDANDSFWTGNGTYYLVTAADIADSVDELDENNNHSRGLNIDAAAIQVVVRRSSTPPVLNDIADVEVWAGQFHAWTRIEASDADGDSLSYSAKAVSLPWHLDQTLNLRYQGSYYENVMGMGERWVGSDQGWHFITPQGQLFRWTGGWGDAFTSELAATLSPQYHQSPSLLHDAPFSNSNGGVTVQGDQLKISPRRLIRIDPQTQEPVQNFEYFEPFVVEVTVNDGSNTVTDSFVVSQKNGLAVELDESIGFNHLTTYWENWLGKGEKWLTSDQGWHYILPNGELNRWGSGLVAKLDPVYHEQPALLHDAQAFQVDHSLRLSSAGSYYENWAGAGEKWLVNQNYQWYFILPNGDLHEWNGRGANGPKIASLGSAFHRDPSLLHEAQARVMDGLMGLTHHSHLNNRLGKNERWFRDRNDNWYYLLPSGRMEQAVDGVGAELLGYVDRSYTYRPDSLAHANDALDDFFSSYGSVL